MTRLPAFLSGTVSVWITYLLACISAYAAVTVVDGTSYSKIDPNIRLFRMYYPTGAKTSDLLPIVVWIHGGGWYSGGRSDASVTPTACGVDQTIACWLADNGYVVFSIDYTLVKVTGSGTDLSVTGALTVKTGQHSFNIGDIGSALNVLAANGWTPGGYRITGAQNGEATLNASPGVTGTLGGRFAVIQGNTLWPAQWQDCNCFLRYLAENVGITLPGDANNIVLMGHSAGGHLVGILGLGGNSAFPTNCDHTSVNYSVKGIVALSPPTDLAALYAASTSAQSPIRNLLGCVPGHGSCDAAASAASIPTYVAQNLPAYISFSGAGDTTVLPSNVLETSQAFSRLSPPVLSQWIEFGPAYLHALDAFYSSNCSLRSEPSPCGSAGLLFQDTLAFINSVGAQRRDSDYRPAR